MSPIRRGVVERQLLELRVWDQLDAGLCEAVARAVESCLPVPWEYKRLARHCVGDQQRWVAFFDYEGDEFALIPGGQVALGWNHLDMSSYTAEELHEWEQFRDITGYPPVEEYLKDSFSPRRTSVFSPVLAGVYADSCKLLRYDPFDDAVGRWVEEMAVDGFRLPSEDLWEYLCSAGGSRLKWWGDGEFKRSDTRSNAFGLLGAAWPMNPYPADAI